MLVRRKKIHHLVRKTIMRELDRQSSKKRIDVQVGNQIYILKNPYYEGPYELGDKLADQIYESNKTTFSKPIMLPI